MTVEQGASGGQGRGNSVPWSKRLERISHVRFYQPDTFLFCSVDRILHPYLLADRVWRGAARASHYSDRGAVAGAREALKEAAGCRIVDHQGAHTPGRPRTAVSGLAVAGGSGAPCGALPQTERAGGPRSFGASSVYARSPAPTLRASASSARTDPALAESGIWRGLCR